jgi:hypothetical protein
MQIAIVQNNTITKIGEISAIFPNVSFPASGADPEWMKEQGVVPVTYFKEYDRATQKLTSVEPYIEGSEVFAVTVEALSPEEVTALAEAAVQNTLKGYASAVQNKLNEVSRERDFDSIEDAASYVLSSDAAWAAEAQAAITWRDAMWKEYYALADKVKAGQEVPNVTEFMEALPAIVWP